MRVVIAEDEALLRQGLAHLLADEGLDVLAAVADERALLERARDLAPDLVITDIRMPPTLPRERPVLAGIVLSHHVDAAGALLLVAEGADGVGYLLKQRVMNVDRFLEACRIVVARGSIIDPEVVAVMMQRRDDGPVARLTPRQLEVLTLMAEGLGNAAIARRLFVTEKAVARHINAILQQLDIPPASDEHRRVRAVLTYLDRR